MSWLNKSIVIIIILLSIYPVPCRGIKVGDKLSVTGKIIMIKIRRAENSLKRLAVKNEEGNIYLLVGKKAKDAKELKGERVRINGIAKQIMTYKGRNRSAIKVKKMIKK